MPEPAFVHPVEGVSVADRVTSEIRHAILSGRLRPGQEFSLRQIAAQLGVSFIPVREALRSLEAEGLLVTRRGRSATVAPLDPSELEAVCQLRRRIEPELAKQACQLHSAAALDQLENRITRCAHLANSVDERFDEFQAIYLDLLRPAATSWDMRVMQLLGQAVERYLRSGYHQNDPAPLSPNDCEKMLRALVSAFRTGDPDTARAATTSFVQRAEHLARERLAPSN